MSRKTHVNLNFARCQFPPSRLAHLHVVREDACLQTMHCIRIKSLQLALTFVHTQAKVQMAMIEVMSVILGDLLDSSPSCSLTVRLDVGAHKAIAGRTGCSCLVQAAIVVIEVVERWHFIILSHCRWSRKRENRTEQGTSLRGSRRPV